VAAGEACRVVKGESGELVREISWKAEAVQPFWLGGGGEKR
jgi:hypothetical protein